MGYHIGITTRNYERQYEGWDSVRQSGDAEFMSLFSDEDKLAPDWNTYGGVFRPIDTGGMLVRLSASAIANKTRYEELLAIMDESDNWWIDYS